MSEGKIKLIATIQDAVTGVVYLVSDTLKEYIRDHIEELLEGQTLRGLSFEGQLKKLRLSSRMVFILTPDEEGSE